VRPPIFAIEAVFGIKATGREATSGMEVTEHLQPARMHC